MPPQTLEGTWEEIVEHASELAGRHVRVTILDKADPDKTENPMKPFPPGVTLADLMKDYIGSASSPGPHVDARHADEIWGDYVVEKHRRNQERKS